MGCTSSQDHPVIEAAGSGDLPRLSQLLKEDPSLHEQLSLGKKSQPLGIAAAAGQLQVVEYLLSTVTPNDPTSLDMTFANIDGFTAIHLAAQGGHLPCLKLLIDTQIKMGQGSARPYKCTTNARHGKWTALHLAASAGHHDTTMYLLTRGCDPDAKTKTNDPMTAEALARKNGHSSLADAIAAKAAEEGEVVEMVYGSIANSDGTDAYGREYSRK